MSKPWIDDGRCGHGVKAGGHRLQGEVVHHLRGRWRVCKCTAREIRKIKRRADEMARQGWR